MKFVNLISSKDLTTKDKVITDLTKKYLDKGYLIDFDNSFSLVSADRKSRLRIGYDYKLYALGRLADYWNDILIVYVEDRATHKQLDSVTLYRIGNHSWGKKEILTPSKAIAMSWLSLREARLNEKRNRKENSRSRYINTHSVLAEEYTFPAEEYQELAKRLLDKNRVHRIQANSIPTITRRRDGSGDVYYRIDYTTTKGEKSYKTIYLKR